MIYELNNIKFNTKRKAINYVFSIIDDIGKDINSHQSVKQYIEIFDGPRFDLFIDVLKKYNNYYSLINSSVSYFIIVRYNDINYLYFMNDSNFKTKVDIQKCFSFKSKQNIVDVMFNTIKSQLIDYNDNNPKCEVCNELSEDIVIKYLLDFDSLITNFFVLNNDIYIPETFRKLQKEWYFKKEDYSFKNRWYVYHKTHTHLKTLCIKCAKI